MSIARGNRKCFIAMKGLLVSVITGIVLSMMTVESTVRLGRYTSHNVGQQTGAISGRVVNDKGEPIVDADVRFVQVGYNVETPPGTDTNEHGEFQMDGLPPGSYRVYASKFDEGYPFTLMRFYQDDWNFPPYVTVTEAEVTSGVVLHIHKGAWLTGIVISDSTKQPIKNAEITLRHANDPHQYHSTRTNEVSSRFKILAPIIPFTIEVTASGYQSWRYDAGDAASQRFSIKLEPGVTRQLIVRLLPSPNSSRR